ncbi:MAG: hypothetical protein KDD62_08925 [Bdellovibrionales bacterium]|nr:hypothetical protein [Bdellovibrionales bacterium]
MHVSIIVTLLAIELASFWVQIDYRSLLGTSGDEPWYQSANRLDKTLLHVHRPRETFKGIQPTGDIAFYFHVPTTSTYPYEVKTDRDGFRNNQDRSLSPYVVLGDSFVEATTVAYDKIFTSRLEDKLGQSVTNLGQIWYGPQQAFEALKRFGLNRAPHTVIWMFFSGNDISDFQRYEKTLEQFNVIQARRDSLVQKSFTLNALRSLKQLWSAKVLSPAFAAQCAPSGETYYFHYQTQALSESDRLAVEGTLRLWREAVDMLASIGSRLIILYAPTKREVMQEVCNLSTEHLPLKSFLQARAQVVLGDGFLFDLTPILAEAAQHDAVYFTDDTHWNEQGHRVVADAILDILNPVRK